MLASFEPPVEGQYSNDIIKNAAFVRRNPGRFVKRQRQRLKERACMSE